LLKINIRVLGITTFTGLIVGSALNHLIATKINMQKNEMDESARGNVSTKGCIFIIAGTFKEKVCPIKEADLKA